MGKFGVARCELILHVSQTKIQEQQLKYFLGCWPSVSCRQKYFKARFSNNYRKFNLFWY